MELVNSFNRLVIGHPADYRSTKRGLTTHGDLTEVPQRKRANASFLGGLDCAWLAALSEWILCLDVRVVDSHGEVFYRS